MISLASTIKKPVLCLDGARVIGHVKDVYFDELCKKAVYFDIDLDKEMFLDVSSIASVADSVVISSAVSLKYPDDIDVGSLQSGLVDMQVFSQTGADRGAIKDIWFTASGKVLRIEAERESFSPAQIAGIGNIMLKKPSTKTAVKQRPRRVMPTPDEDSPVYILEEPTPPIALTSDSREPVFTQDAFNALLGAQDMPAYEPDAHTPTRIICEYDFLLGRTLGADLATYTGELIAQKGAEVTAETVERARRAGKLVELTLNSIKK